MAMPVVICPLAYERSFLTRALKGRATLLVSGPGPDRAARAVEAVGGHANPKPPLVVLCGTAGALRDCEPAPRVGAVIDSEARRWEAPALVPGSDAPVAVLGLDEVVASPARKAQLAGAFGAHLVDTESASFAEACERLGLRWAIVRAVSDGPREALPAGVAEWVDERGRARPLRLIGQCVLEPRTMGAALRLRARTKPAMRTAASRLVELLAQERDISVDPLARRKPTKPDRAPRDGAEPTVVEQQLSIDRIESERAGKRAP
ncbi:MAG TPA: hypothetical protein DEB06_04235 [Phycisphaerales bacterium]|nr:hypothetical protein [Phycisphaerales bacterium]